MKKCSKCGSGEFYISGHCKMCKKAIAAAYRKNNPEKVKAVVKKCWEENKSRYDEQKRKHYHENSEYRKAKVAEYRAKNPEKVKASKDRCYQNNREKYLKTKAEYYAANLDKFLIYSHNRRLRKTANGGKLSVGLKDKLMKLQKGKCACCGNPLGVDFHIDHIIPLALGGENVDSNTQLLRKKCNLQKGVKHPVDFMQQKGFLI